MCDSDQLFCLKGDIVIQIDIEIAMSECAMGWDGIKYVRRSYRQSYTDRRSIMDKHSRQSDAAHVSKCTHSLEREITVV